MGAQKIKTPTLEAAYARNPICPRCERKRQMFKFEDGTGTFLCHKCDLPWWKRFLFWVFS